ncbi:DUF3943 domain-containing protein [Ferrimonas marina]|uniref:Outer membrane protein beta-barrel domain-containing protein n=1 Tax=Ferrimonas marina TaxID=299255 RepID=A0A1M5ZPY4_9GAMM|nr:DUF3943 domain-containing protein [Ferrimonas marina]SHI26337.1 Outer membrane protein beta-barrel domain-containing protein [Ferrimonas marina]
MTRRTFQGLSLVILLMLGPWVQAEEESIYRPAITNTSWEQIDREASIYDSPYKVSLFSAEHGEDKERMWSQTKSIAGYGLGVAGFLALLPSDFTNWDKEDAQLASKWWNNVTGGPVWDRDVWYINYIGHPYFGGVYYQVARKSGYRQWDAFMYSFLMSTFYWEYGIEAFAEVPSIQDLVVTPVLGWVYGEWAFHKEREILERGGTVMGSEMLGSTSLFFLDPVDSLGRGVNRLFGKDVIKAGTGYVGMSAVEMHDGRVDEQVQLTFQYSIGAGEASPGISRHRPDYRSYSSSGDPVDFGMVGMTIGMDYLSTDDYWGVDNGWAPSISLGIYFTRSFSARLSYNRARFNDVETGKEVTLETYTLDGQYYFNAQEKLRPYLTAGFGETMREQSLDDKAFQVHGGLGLHYRLNANWALQADWRHYHSTRLNSHDDQLGARLVYRFGKGERAL